MIAALLLGVAGFSLLAFWLWAHFSRPDDCPRCSERLPLEDYHKAYHTCARCGWRWVEKIE